MKTSPLILAMTWAALWTLPAAGQVNLPDGFELVEFGFSVERTQRPTLNNCGQVAYSKSDVVGAGEIYLYDNGRIFRITENEIRDVIAYINDSGTMVWSRDPTTGGVKQIILYQHGVERVLDDHPLGVGDAKINNLGHVVWTRVYENMCPIRGDIFRWDGQRVRQIDEDDDFLAQGAVLNELGDAVWGQSDHCVNPWVGSIHYRSGRRTIVLPSASTQPQVPDINNQRQVAWVAWGTFEWWENGRTRTLIDPAEGPPQINDDAWVAFIRWHPENEAVQPWLCVSCPTSPEYFRLRDDGRYYVTGSINKYGEAAWLWLERPLEGNNAGGVLLLRRLRTGDAGFDGAIDLTDYRRLAECMTGPDWDELHQRGPDETLCDCRFMDLDHDGDVDLSDFALFQNSFTE